METADPPFFSVDDLSFRFPPVGVRSEWVLDGVCLRLSRHGVGVVFGRADAGKTTLGRIAAGLVPRFTGGTIAGSVTAGGKSLRGVAPFDLVQAVGLVAQDSDEQLLTTRCDTEVAFALESMGVPRDEMRRRVAESLERTGLAGFEGRNPATLSGGEKKRLLLACLDAIRPDLWILDEALGELDFQWKRRVWELISDRGGTSIFLESRWTSLVEEKGTSFFLLQGGRIVAQADRCVDRNLEASLSAAGIKPPRKHPAGFSSASDGELVLEGLQFSFGSSAFRLHVPRLELRFGETCALVGRNGSGKSTLARILCGLLPPKAGTAYRTEAGNARQLAFDSLRSRVGYLFQNPDHQIFLPTVREELAFGLRSRRLPSPELERRVREAAARFDLSHLDAPPALLSYGARRRLQAATYYLLSRDLLILDEIDSGLSYGEIQSLLRALSSAARGLVLITHDMDLARMTCQRLLVLEEGMIVQDSPCGDAP